MIAMVIVLEIYIKGNHNLVEVVIYVVHAQTAKELWIALMDSFSR